MISPSTGIRIQQAREERGITQRELAARLGCTHAALSNYELGKRRLYLANLERIAGALVKPLSCFMEPPFDEHDTRDWGGILTARVQCAKHSEFLNKPANCTIVGIGKGITVSQ
jgi:transcriptional regulator with XRE-family HTH domain